MKRKPYIEIDNEIVDPQLVIDAFERKALFDVLEKSLKRRNWKVTMGEDKDSQYIKIERS